MQFTSRKNDIDVPGTEQRGCGGCVVFFLAGWRMKSQSCVIVFLPKIVSELESPTLTPDWQRLPHSPSSDGLRSINLDFYRLFEKAR